jgi:dipeptidyl aminopeptidase/acylaminoacyl peptidase
MKYLVFSLFASLVIIVAALILKPHSILSPISGFGPTPTPTIAPLLKYRITSLEKRTPRGSTITIDKPDESVPAPETYNMRLFSFKTDGKKVSGRLTYPTKPGTYPLVYLIRGYVDREIYYPGIGTEHAANYLAEHGYITLAPDFLGYGTSDTGSADGLEDRFQTYTTLMDLIDSSSTLSESFKHAKLPDFSADTSKQAIWAHSNGGQIALTVLAVTQKPYPTVLWAPVSKPFPYNILYYSDEAPDEGYSLRRLIAKFEDVYDVRKYSFTDYLNRIKAPIRIHQGTADEAVPVAWTDLITTRLKEASVDAEVAYHEGENHNFNLGSWNDTMDATEAFYRNEFDKTP